MRKSHLILWLLAAVVARAQTEATVAGRVIDARTEAPLPFATITVIAQADALTLTEVLADEQGRFVVSGLPEGRKAAGSSRVSACSAVGFP